MQIAPGSIVGGKYRLERPLSRGGMGTVWLARHAKLGSPMAVKFMDPAYATTPAFVARFEREARIAANLRSPHVVHVQDYGIDEGVPYLVMELLQGEDLGDRLQRVGRLSLQDSARLLAQAGKALRRAHEAGLVHRDLKPGNLFLAQVEDEEIVKILDFGIVKETGQLSGERTGTGEVLGSPHYMSPDRAAAVPGGQAGPGDGEDPRGSDTAGDAARAGSAAGDGWLLREGAVAGPEPAIPVGARDDR